VVEDQERSDQKGILLVYMLWDQKYAQTNTYKEITALGNYIIMDFTRSFVCVYNERI
jgi:hypothetical protein